jgi:hypothetical protein
MLTRFSKTWLIGICLFAAAASAAPAQTLLTPAESTEYRQGGTLYGPLMEFIYSLESQTDLMNVKKLTRTLGGRDMVVCILSDPPVYSPADVFGSGKPVVLIANNVHGSEVAGKDASLEIMRDLVMGELRPLLKKVVVLNIPTLNPDGAEAGRRTNEQAFDMNRDYLKLESQEIHALVTEVINRWHPDIHVDTHHGGAAPYALVYQTCMNPAGDPELIRFGNEEIAPRIRAALQAEDYDGFWYSGGRWVDDEAQWSPTSVEPRKQHVYSALANVACFLFETPSGSHRVINNGTEVVSIPEEERYRHQVRGQYIGQRELIRFAAERGEDLRAVIAGARMNALVRGNDDGDGDLIPIVYEQEEKFKEDFWIRKQDGEPGEFVKVEGSVRTLFEPTRTAVRPWGYLMPPEMAPVVPLLLDHGIAVKRLTEPAELEAEVYYARDIRHPQYFQGHYLKQVQADKKIETIKLPEGSFFVPSGQEKSNLISYILEPETNDNLATWGYLDNYIQVTTGLEEQRKRQEEEMAGYLADMPPERRERMQRRFEERRKRLTQQRIPIYRLMKKTGLKGELVRPFNEYRKNRYIKD